MGRRGDRHGNHADPGRTLAGRARIRRLWRRGTAALIDWLLIGVVVSLSIGYHGQLAPPHSTVKVVVIRQVA